MRKSRLEIADSRSELRAIEIPSVSTCDAYSERVIQRMRLRPWPAPSSNRQGASHGDLGTGFLGGTQGRQECLAHCATHQYLEMPPSPAFDSLSLVCCQC